MSQSSSRMYASRLAVAILGILQITALDASAAKLRAGAAVVDITPEKLPVSMVGSFAERLATSVHDRLHARCLVLDDGTTNLAILTADTCLISRETFDEAKKRAAEKTGIPASHILMSVTHTHSGATAMDLGNFKADEAYVEFLTARMAEAIERATAKLEPAKLGYGTAPLASEVHNRRWKVKPGVLVESPFPLDDRVPDQVLTNPGLNNPNVEEPAGPTDPDVMVLAVQTAAGKPLALYGVYSLHYVGGTPANALSADYFGEFAKQVREKLGESNGEKDDESFVALLANGTSGDINNVDVKQRRLSREPMEQSRLVAGRVADVALGVYRQVKLRDDVVLSSTERELKLGVRKPSAADVAVAKRFLENLTAIPTIAATRAQLEKQTLYLNETLKLGDFPDEVSIKLQVLRIGGLAIASIPGEPFAEIGLEIKRRSLSAESTFVVGLANGYYGYIPTPEQHRLGGYETWCSRWSYLEVGASTKIIDTLAEMLNEKP